MVNKRIFLLGCSGEVGFRLTLKLLKKGFIVKGIRGSKPCKIEDKNHFCTKVNLLTSNESLNLKDFKPDVMIHCAWITTPKEFWNSPLNIDWVRVSKKLIMDFEASGGKYLGVTSTCAEYSWHGGRSLSETAEVDPQSIYGKSKLELLNWIEQRDLPFLWTRTFFQFGLNEPTGKLIPSIIDAILKGDSFEVQNEHDVRDFIYINDVVSALDVLICQEELGIINLGTGSGTAIRSITDLIANKMGRNDLIQYKSIYGATSTVVSNPEKLLSRISDHRWTPLDLAITETIRSRSKLFYLKTNNMKI